MNVFTYTRRDRERIVALHTRLADAIEGADLILFELAECTAELGRSRATQTSVQA